MDTDPVADTPPGDPAELVHDAICPAGKLWPASVRVLPAERPLGRRETDSTMFESWLRRALEGLDDDIDLAVMDVPPRAAGVRRAPATSPAAPPAPSSWRPDRPAPPPDGVSWPSPTPAPADFAQGTLDFG